MDMGKVDEAYASTYYGCLSMLDEIGADIDRDPANIRAYGLDGAHVLSIVLEEEINAVWDECRGSDRSFDISIDGIAESSGLSIRRVIRCLKRLGGLSFIGRLRHERGAINIIARGGNEWRVSAGLDFQPWDDDEFVLNAWALCELRSRGDTKSRLRSVLVTVVIKP
jgi:hypothetical protein